MKKIKIPFLSKEDIQTQTANTDILRSYATNSFIEKNLGKKGSDEFADYFADIVMESYKKRDAEISPKNVVSDWLQWHGGVLGRDVEGIENEDGSVTFNDKKCSDLRAKMAYMKWIGERVTSEECFNEWVEFNKKIFEKAGLKVDAEISADGCKITLRK